MRGGFVVVPGVGVHVRCVAVRRMHFALGADAGWRAQHGGRHRAPNREQRGEHHQEPETKDLHGGQD